MLQANTKLNHSTARLMSSIIDALLFNVLLIALPTLVLLLRSSKLFILTKDLTTFQKRSVYGYFVALCLPVMLFVGYRFYQAIVIQDDYAIIQRKVSNHIYRPTFLPGGMIQTSKFFLNDAGGVNVTYGYNSLISGRFKEGLVIISQSKTTPNHNFEDFDFIQNNREGDSIQSVPVLTAKNKMGLLSIKRDTNSRLYFVTPDDVNVLIFSSTIEDSEFAKIADSLR